MNKRGLGLMIVSVLTLLTAILGLDGPTPPRLTADGRAWHLQVVGSDGRDLTQTVVEPLVDTHGSLGQQFSATGPAHLVSAERIVPLNATMVPALDMIGALGDATSLVHYSSTSTTRPTYRFHPVLVRTTVSDQLSMRIAGVLPADSSAVVVAANGSVLSLIGPTDQWRARVAAGPALLLPILAEADALPWFQKLSSSTSLLAVSKSWGVQGMTVAWDRLGLEDSALVLNPSPEGSSSLVLTQDASAAPLTSIARAYLPFIDQGRIPDLRLKPHSGSAPMAAPLRQFSAISNLLPVVPVSIDSQSTTQEKTTTAPSRPRVLLWRPLHSAVTVVWSTTSPRWVLVLTHAPVDVAPVVTAISTTLATR